MLMIEQLEPRVLMAAKVTQSGGTLQITGDNDADAFLITGNGLGSVEVFADLDGDGVANDSLGTFTGVKNIKMDTKGGDDDVGFVNVELLGNVSVKTGGGDDCVLMVGCEIGRNVSVNTGNGDDVVSVSSLFDEMQIGGKLNIKTGHGNDAVAMESMQVAKAVNVNTGNGDDIIAVEELTVGGRTTLNGGRGADYLVGDELGVLNQQLNQLGAKVRNIETLATFDDLPPELLLQHQVRFAEGFDRLNI